VRVLLSVSGGGQDYVLLGTVLLCSFRSAPHKFFLLVPASTIDYFHYIALPFCSSSITDHDLPIQPLERQTPWRHRTLHSQTARAACVGGFSCPSSRSTQGRCRLYRVCEFSAFVSVLIIHLPISTGHCQPSGVCATQFLCYTPCPLRECLRPC
jgi:hypothetical protein